jgi:hypothetical protein
MLRSGKGETVPAGFNVSPRSRPEKTTDVALPNHVKVKRGVRTRSYVLVPA